MAVKKSEKTDPTKNLMADPFASMADVSTTTSTAKSPKGTPKKVVQTLSNTAQAAKGAAETTPEPKKRAVKKVIAPPASDAWAETAAASDSKRSVTEGPSVTKSSPAKRPMPVEIEKPVSLASAPSTLKSGKTKATAKRKTTVRKSPRAAKRPSSPATVAEPLKGGRALNSPAMDAVNEVENSPVFKALADVKLPELPRENRAWLQMQSPTRLYAYWSLRSDPWHQLRAVFGPEVGSYTLVLKIRNLTEETEQIHQIAAEGEWWVNGAEPNSEYMAEIGFYATNRPYFRILYSNTVETPRRSPSPHLANEARWTVSATKFAEVLDASGFTRDAVDVAIAGDDHLSSEHRTHLAFSRFVGETAGLTKSIAAEDIRYAMLAIAGGAKLDDLRNRVSASLFDVLQSSGDLTAVSARAALSSEFEIDETEWVEHEAGPAVFGASLVNFPIALKPRKDVKYSPRYNPVSSFSLGR